VSRRVRFGLGVCILGGAAGWAQNGPTALASGVTPDLRAARPGSTIQYDGRGWRVVKRLRATFEKDAAPSSVVLLQSLVPTGRDGLGDPLNDVKLVVLGGETVLYDYVKDRAKPGDIDIGFYMDDFLEVRDVTRDGIPEILYHSGYRGASDSTTIEHILRYDKSRVSFTDVALPSFDNSGTHGLRWLESKGRNFVVIADRKWSDATPLEDRCHYCSSPFEYDVCEWSKKEGSFIVYRHLFGKRSYSDSGVALKGDWPLIQSGLKP